MDLDYKIIWADDSHAHKFMVSYVQNVEKYISSKGFSPYVTKLKNLTQLKEAIESPSKCRDIDLIISDYNLGKGKHCTEILELMAKDKVYAELVLYTTGSNTLKQELLKQDYITRITVLDRASMELDDEINQIIGWHLEKEFDLESFRGIVLNESSKIDTIMEDILRTVLTINEGSGYAVYAHEQLLTLCESHLSKLEHDLKAYQKLDFANTDDVDKFISSLDSRKKSRGIDVILKGMKCKNHHDSKLYSKLQDKRNRLGHDERDHLEEIKIDYNRLFSEFKHYNTILHKAHDELRQISETL